MPAWAPEHEAVFDVTTPEDSSIIIAVKPQITVTNYPAAAAEIVQLIVKNIRAAGMDYPTAIRDIRIVVTSAAWFREKPADRW